MKYRKALISDIPDIVSLNSMEIWGDIDAWQKLEEYDRWQDGLWWCDPRLLKWYLSVLETTGGGIILAIDDDEIVGQIDYCLSYDLVANSSGRRCHIIWLLVSPDRRKEGIASGLVHQLDELITLPIWVEPEDHRSKRLYEKLGTQVHTISNWVLKAPEYDPGHTPSGLTTSPITFDHVLAQLQSKVLLLGRYYAPEYDIQQLYHSDPVHEYMWGNTKGPTLKSYEIGDTEADALLTQYPRILINQGFREQELRAILEEILSELFLEGFSEVYFQIYNNTGISPILRSLNFTCMIEKDPVFEINPSL